MSSYRGTADRPGFDNNSRAKAIAAVVAVHAALAFVILSGLNVRMVRSAVERLTTSTAMEMNRLEPKLRISVNTAEPSVT